MRRAANIAISAIALMGISALLLTSASGCGGEPAPAMTVYYQVGQPAQTSREVLTVMSASRTSQYKKGSFLARLVTAFVTAPPGTVFIIVEVTVTNIGQDSFGISSKDFTLKDSEGHEYHSIGYSGADPYPSRKLAFSQGASGYVAFNPLAIATGFEVSCVVQGSPPVLGVWQLPY